MTVGLLSGNSEMIIAAGFSIVNLYFLRQMWTGNQRAHLALIQTGAAGL